MPVGNKTSHSDALDTLAVMGNYSEFRRVYSIIEKRTDFDANINVSVFETNIRIVGGLLAAHLVARRAGVEVENYCSDLGFSSCVIPVD